MPYSIRRHLNASREAERIRRWFMKWLASTVLWHCWCRLAQRSLQKVGVLFLCRETVLGSSGPAFSLAGKANSPRPAAESDALRGPGVYYNPQAEAALQGGKAFTIGSRLVVGEAAAGQDSPGPASYSLPVERLGPAITIAGRPKLPGEQLHCRLVQVASLPPGHLCCILPCIM